MRKVLLCLGALSALSVSNANADQTTILTEPSTSNSVTWSQNGLTLPGLSANLIAFQDDRPSPRDRDSSELQDSIEKLRSELKESDKKSLVMPEDEPDEKEEDADREDEESGDQNWLSESTGMRSTRSGNGRLILPALKAPSTATAGVGNGQVPRGFRKGQPGITRVLPESGEQRNLDGQPWAWSVSRWAAPNTFSNPRYFEDRMLERHGYQKYPALQPIVSGARFFATAPAMPYLMTLSPPAEHESTLGYYRPGSCAPVMHQRPPLDFRAAVVEGLALGVGAAIVP